MHICKDPLLKGTLHLLRALFWVDALLYGLHPIDYRRKLACVPNLNKSERSRFRDVKDGAREKPSPLATAFQGTAS